MNYKVIGNKYTKVVIISYEYPESLSDILLNNRESLRKLTYTYGGILFRGFPIDTSRDFEQFINLIRSEDWGEYREASTPRTQIHNQIYTSTDFPKSQSIYLHNENSHVMSWPAKLYFYCKNPAETGGETPLIDCRSLFNVIHPNIRRRFEIEGITYRRVFGYGLGIDWQTAFNITSKDALDTYCYDNDIRLSWRDANHVEIQYTRWASALHPITGESVWFNHGTFYNLNNVSPMQSLIAAEIGRDNMPYHSLFGNGEEISVEIIDHLHECHLLAQFSFSWEQGDILLIDNMLMGHSRNAYTGNRQILVGMTGRIHCDDVITHPESKHL